MIATTQPNAAFIMLLFSLAVTSIKAWTTQRSIFDSRRSSTRRFISPQQLGSFEELETTCKSERRVLLEDFLSIGSLHNNSYVAFEDAWDWQKFLLQEHVNRLESSSFAEQPMRTVPFVTEEDMKGLQHDHGEQTSEKTEFLSGGLDTVIILEHKPVYTLGTGSDEKFILSSQSVPTVRMDRGGEVTYHGPGQLVVYLVLDLRSYRQDIHWYMRALEEAILVALRACGVESATRDADTTGVWVHNKKVAAIGVKCKKWITMHGLAVNVEPNSLDNFQGIVPCGLEGREVACLNDFLDGPRISTQDFARHMRAGLEEVFKIKLVTRPRKLSEEMD